MTLHFRGSPTHAAYLENGVSPAGAVGKLLCALPSLSDSVRYRGMTLCTVIGVEMGEKAFGAAAAGAEVWLTLRAEHDSDLSALHDAVIDCAERLALERGFWPLSQGLPGCIFRNRRRRKPSTAPYVAL